MELVELASIPWPPNTTIFVPLYARKIDEQIRVKIRRDQDFMRWAWQNIGNERNAVHE